MPPPSLLLWLVILLFSPAFCYEEAKDGKIYKIDFGSGKSEVTYHYTPIDKDATLSIMVYPQDDNSGNVETSVCREEECTNIEMRHSGFFSFDIPVSYKIGEDSGVEIDLTNKGIYINISGDADTKVRFAIISSIIIHNNDEVTITKDDNYDYQGNGYMRYYRVFVCNKDEAEIIMSGDELGKVTLYLNGWGDESRGEEPGRPNNMGAKTCQTTCYVSNLTNAIYPGWVFVGVNVEELFTYTPGEGEQFNASITLKANLEPAEELKNDVYLEQELCLYNECNQLIMFDAGNWVGADNADNSTLTILYMITENYPHEQNNLLRLDVGDSLPISSSSIYHKTITDNLFEFSAIDAAKLSDLQAAYVSVSVVAPYKFPLPIPIGEVINVGTTMMKDTSVVGIGRSYNVLTLQRSTSEKSCSGEPVNYSRVILDTVGVNKPRYAVDTSTDELPEITCNYLVVAKADSESNGTQPSFHVGIYLGSGEKCISEEYLLESKTIVSENSTQNTKNNFELLTISSNSPHYFQDGAYIMDIYTTDVDTTETTQDIKVEVAAHPSWLLRKNTQYEMTLNGSSRFDFFTIELNDISNGFSFSVEPSYTTSSNMLFNIYASFENGTPDVNSRFTSSGQGRADLYISPEELKELEESYSGYNVFVAVDTLFNGDVLIYYGEGNSVEYNLNDSESMDIILSPEKTTASIAIHIEESLKLPELYYYLDGFDNEWEDGVVINVCISTDKTNTIEDCKSGKKRRLSKTIPVLGDEIDISVSEANPTYFIFMSATYPENVATPMNVKVYTHKMMEASVTSLNYMQMPIIPKSILVHLETQTEYDYTLNFVISNYDIARARYDIRVCADYPSLSSTEPPDVGSDNVRNCVTYLLTGGNELTFDLIGDSLANEGTITNDLNFILSTKKYISVYPVNHIPNAEIQMTIFEDEHIDSNEKDAPIWGEYDTTKYFRLHILSVDTVHVNDMLNFGFDNELGNPVDYCLSREPHVEMNADNCIKYHVSETIEEQEFHVNEIVRLTDIDPYYDAKHDIYVYFAIRFPAAIESDPHSMHTMFSNVVIHYLDIIESSSDDIDYKSYFFEMYNERTIAFYTMNVLLNDKFMFFIVPDVVENDYQYVSTSYSTSEIVIKSLTSIENGLPSPSLDDCDAHGAGILINEYNIESENNNVFIVVASFAKDYFTNGLYKAGFVDTSNDSEHSFAQITNIKLDTAYSFSNDNPDGTTPSNYLKSTLFYYPDATSDKILKVFPCAGAPGVYLSYLNPLPKINEVHVQGFPNYGYPTGKPFKGAFLDADFEDIVIPTGFIINATAYAFAYYNEDDPFNKLRWDAELRLIDGDSSTATGGPIITNSNIRVTKQKGAEVTVEIEQALSGFSNNPNYGSTYIEYTIYALPAVDDDHKVEYFDASSETHCGLMKFGFPLIVDKSNSTKWIKGETSGNSNDSNENWDKLYSTLELISNVKPSDYKYADKIRPNYYDPNEDNTLSKDQLKEANKKYNINVLAREYTIDSNGNKFILGYSSYSHVQLSISGSLPVSEGGLFSWEIAIIVVACSIVVGVAIAIAVICIKRKKKAMGYMDVDGQGAPKKNVVDDVLEDNLHSMRDLE